MAFRCFRILAPPLSTYVDSVWVFDNFSQTHARESVLPTGTFDMTISLAPDDRNFSSIAGVRSSAVVIPAANTLNLVAVHFRPGGGFAFFDLPAGELQDRIVPLDVLWGSSLRFLRDELLETGSATQKCRIVEKYLLSRLNAGRVFHPAVRYALRELQENGSQSSIAAIRDKAGYGAKRFIQLFRDEVGTTPKLLQRIVRFNGILRLLDGRADLDWTEVAHASGYFDQSHFNHDFRQFCGFCPGTYVRNRVTQTHVRIPD